MCRSPRPCLPLRMSYGALVKKRAPWILSHASAGILEATPKRFVSGETLPYLGRNVRMVVESGNVRSPQVRFDHWRFQVVVPEGIGDVERFDSVRRAVIAWYRDRARERLTAGGRAVVATSEQWRTIACAHPRPAPTLGKLRA